MSSFATYPIERAPFHIVRAKRVNNGEIEEIELSTRKNIESDSVYSTIIGINGVGKSRFLGDLARTFSYLYRAQRSAAGELSNKRMPLVYIEYVAFGDCYVVMHGEGGFASFFKNRENCKIHEIALPRKVVALTISAFDKFPLSNRSIDALGYKEEEFYSYIGARGRFGRAGAGELLLNAIESLLRSDEDKDSRRLGLFRMFLFLGYEPRLTLRYRWSSPPSSFIEAMQGQNYRSERIRRFVDKGRLNQEDLYFAYDLADKYSEPRRFIRVEIDITEDGEINIDRDLVKAILLLKNLGIIKLKEVTIRHKSGADINLMDASSGELSIITNFLGLGSVIKDESLVLIDEPEISLHPEWQSSYFDIFRSTFGGYTGCHFVVATHSPLIVSDAKPKDTHVLNLDHRGDADAEELSGQSSDLILAKAFGIVEENNLFLKDILTRALKLAARGEFENEEFNKLVDQLAQLLPNMSDHDLSKRLVLGVLEARDSVNRD